MPRESAIGDSGDRAARIAAFLDATGWRDAAREPVAGDASFRRYDRLRGRESTAILMDAPPPQEDVRAFRAVAELLAEMGFSAPRVLAAEEGDGLLLLEDLGARTFARALDEGADPEPLYRLATDTLVALQQAFTPQFAAAAALPAYDDALLIEREANLLVDWYLPAVGIAPDRALRASYAGAWEDALAWAHRLPRTIVLRDFFPDNLMCLPQRQGTDACGLLDFQDAVHGACAYDLASLLQDARRDVDAELEAAMIARYLDAFPALDAEAFRAGYTVLAAQRHAKVIGIFTRLAHRDGKPGYLRHLPRLWRLLARDLEHPALARVKAWFDTQVPPEARRIPPEEPPA